MSQALKNRLVRLERLAIPDPGLRVHVVVDGETAPASSGVKGTLIVQLSDVGDIPIMYHPPQPLDY